ncbi:MAG: NADH:ubiquinone reductase (Na(+)-transporting) subunit E [Simkaniaceae bacterium]
MMGSYTFLNLVGLMVQTLFIQNILLFYFLGMCSYLACSGKLVTANGLGMAVTFVTFLSGTANWFINRYLTGEGALKWIGLPNINVNFLQLLIYISVIAALVQVLEIVIDKFSPSLYRSLGMYLPLITVNCAILGASLFATVRDYPLIPHCVYVFSAGLGWWLAILLIASIREKLTYSNVVPGFKGMGITFITTGLISLAFMGFAGINLDQVTQNDTYTENESTITD